MKNVLILLFVFLVVVCFADPQKLQFPPTTTLQEISTQTNIPVKKITQYLKLDNQTDFNVSLKELGISNEAINKAISEYNTNTKSFYIGITFVGMGIVFASLLLVGFIINSLQHISESKKKINIKIPVGTVTAPKEHISSNGIVAAITAMFLHDADEKDKINLTWKRQAFSGWHAAGMVENKVFENRRGKI